MLTTIVVTIYCMYKLIKVTVWHSLDILAASSFTITWSTEYQAKIRLQYKFEKWKE